jgi:hypothetical protein
MEDTTSGLPFDASRTLPCVRIDTLAVCIKAQQPLWSQPYSPDKGVKNIYRSLTRVIKLMIAAAILWGFLSETTV